jgi:CheY-like chemotaxis protein
MIQRGFSCSKMGLSGEIQMKDVLVVDDDRTILDLIKLILQSEGMVAHCVSSGAEALERITERTFSLMITDYNMPGLDGLELASKGLELAPHMPIIMNTGDLSPNLARLAEEIGIAKVMSKPYLPRDLIESIRAAVGHGSAPSARTREAKQGARPYSAACPR